MIEDGFNGMVYLVYFALGLVAIALILPLCAVARFLLKRTLQPSSAAFWCAIAACALSLVIAIRTLQLLLTEHHFQLRILVCCGTACAILGVLCSLRIKGAGKGLATTAALFHVLAWTPVFMGRVLQIQ